MPGRMPHHTQIPRSPVDRRAIPPAVDEGYLVETILRLLEERNVSITPEEKKIETTFTLTQVIGGLFALATLVGSVIATWVSLNTQIATQKVSSDLVIEQIRKDIIAVENQQKESMTKLNALEVSMQNVSKDSLNTDVDKELKSKIEVLDSTTQASLKALALKLSDMDTSLNQLYTRPQK